MYPEQFRYSKEHEWIDTSASGDTATVGITHYAQEKLGDVVFVELPEVGATLKSMESFGTVESVKAVSDLFIPAAGSVAEINAALEDSPQLVNEDPHGKGWLVKIKLADATALDALMTAEQYGKFVEEAE